MINKEHIQIVKEVKDWKEAIRVGAQPLLKDKIINNNYIEQMIKNIEDMGAYIVIAENIALPHARPEDGANRSGISILKLEEKVSFSETKEVNTIIVLASSSNDDHLVTLKLIADILSNKDNYYRLINTNSIDEIYNIWSAKS